MLDKHTSMVDAFRVADDVLRQGVQGISDLVTLPGLINLDFADVRTIMSDAGNALLGIGMGTGERARASRRPSRPCRSPLLETSMEGARSILLSITGGDDLSLWEVNEAAKAVAEAAHPDANIIFGAMVDEKLERPGLGHGRRDALRRAPRPRAARRCEEPAGRAARPAPRAAAGAASTAPARTAVDWAWTSSTSRSSCRDAELLPGRAATCRGLTRMVGPRPLHGRCVTGSPR